MFYFSKKVRLFSQNDVLFLFYFLINPAGTTEPVTPLTPPPQEVPVFESVRDLDRQCQWQFNQTVAKQQSSSLEDEQRKRAKTPLQPDPEDAPSGKHLQMPAVREGETEGSKHGHSQARKSEEQREPGHSKSKKARSKSRACNKSKVRSKSRVHQEHKEGQVHETCEKQSQIHSKSQGPNKSHDQTRTKNQRGISKVAPCTKEESDYEKLKEEVMRCPHEYIQGHTKLITYTLTKHDPEVHCLLVFGTSALLYAAEILATVEWEPSTGR